MAGWEGDERESGADGGAGGVDGGMANEDSDDMACDGGGKWTESSFVLLLVSVT